MPRHNSIRIMIVDDHAIVREGFAAMITAQPNAVLVAEAGSGEEAIKLYRQHQPDITLMDLRMPGIGGVAAVIQIRKEYPKSRFIALTTYAGDEDIYSALRAGVQAYLLKGMSFDELLEAIKAVHAGLRYIPKEISDRLHERELSVGLTERETEVLALIVKGKKNKDIANTLGVTESTVKWHITTILTKLGVEDRTQAVTMAIQRGIVHLS